MFALAKQIANTALVALMFIIPGIMMLSFWWSYQSDTHLLSLVPNGFGVKRIIGQTSVGDLDVPLPSANGKMLVLYELDTDISAQIAEGGVAELAARSRSRAENAAFLDWRSTPFTFSDAWPAELSSGSEDAAEIDDFLGQYWGESMSTPELEQQVTDFLHAPGNFYSIGADRRRILVVAPASGRLAYGFGK